MPTHGGMARLVTFYFHSTDGATVAIRFSVTVYGYGLSRVSVRVTVKVSISVSIINVYVEH